MNKEIYFLTTNIYKQEEVKQFFIGTGIELKAVNMPIQEIMDLDLETIIKDKLLKGYRQFGLPCTVEHGAIHIDALNRLPGGISKVVWDNLGDKICSLIAPSEQRTAIAKSVVGYCDGRKMHFFTGETKGTISLHSKGDRKFQWDPIFIPEGTTKTYSEMDLAEKERFSQGKKAWLQLINFLQYSH